MQLSEAALYLPGLAETLIRIGWWVCVTLTILLFGLYAIARLLRWGVKEGFDPIGAWASICLRVGSILLLIFGTAILGIQLFLWAKTGIWNSVPTAIAFWLIVDLSPIYFPPDWKGFATVVAWVLAFPLSITSLIIGAFGYWQAGQIWDGLRRSVLSNMHPQPGDPDYFDWANRRGRYAVRGEDGRDV